MQHRGHGDSILSTVNTLLISGGNNCVITLCHTTLSLLVLSINFVLLALELCLQSDDYINIFVVVVNYDLF